MVIFMSISKNYDIIKTPQISTIYGGLNVYFVCNILPQFYMDFN